jgi:hypothetical protein
MGLNGRVGKIIAHSKVIISEKELKKRGKREPLGRREENDPS